MKASQNPYRVQRLEELLKYEPELMGSNWEEIEQALSVGSGAVVGCKGSGKTSLLEAYAARIEESVNVKMWRLQEDSVAGKILNEVEDWLASGDLAIVDSAGLLNFWQARRLRQLARRKKVIVSLHVPSRYWKTLWECQSNADLLSKLNCRLGQGELETEDAQKLLHACDGNIRSCFHTLYDAIS